MKHTHAWNWDRKEDRNLCYKHNQQNQVHEHLCKEMGKNCEDLLFFFCCGKNIVNTKKAQAMPIRH
jgi:hypothetical protein